ncbi:LexA family transcriptional regulator [Actinoplanes sp. SE50]|uniref:transcriptional repressor LexA n=1 Tax=unclassified Actinoplanes TaxID=2626549 RepID=UPI00023EC69C|nr:MULTISPECIES: transcriptional repressor LexA [unclassified Actinoplanes]AEV86437.1 repressor LexA [Actinoplanes sp. SE50/110]ATO84835.1 LexA family transcriptional regulator [Actinoplanes sp. SE50]SLM02244.1 repressor LexA [Actinoplanes sp. SE50/110]
MSVDVGDDDGSQVPPALKQLTPKQQRILTVIRDSVRDRGFPPTVREIGAAVGLVSPSSVAHHLKVLERHGLLRRQPNGSRAVDVRTADPAVTIPVLGDIAAGVPILAEQHVLDHLTVSAGMVGHGTLFALNVKGDSMIDAAICDGDVVIVRQQPVAENGEIVAAMLDGEATVKTFQRRNGHIELIPQNPNYAVIPGDDATILGKVVSVIRRL